MCVLYDMESLRVSICARLTTLGTCVTYTVTMFGGFIGLRMNYSLIVLVINTQGL